jgi:hypothetical protein
MMAAQHATPNRSRLQAAAITARIGDALVKAHVIDDMQLRSAMAQQEKFGGRIAGQIAELQFAPENAIVAELARVFRIERADLGMVARDPEAISKLDANFCQQHGVFPISIHDSGKTLWVAMAEPCDLELVDTIASKARCRVKEFIAGEREIMSAIDRHYHRVEHSGAKSGSGSAAQVPTREAEFSATSEEREEDSQFSISMRRPATPPPMSAVSIAATPPDLVEQIKYLRERLDKATRVVRALVDLGQSKGLFTAEEIRAAMGKLGKGD